MEPSHEDNQFLLHAPASGPWTMSSKCGKFKLAAQAGDLPDNLSSTGKVDHGVQAKPLGVNLVAVDDGPITQLRHIAEKNLGPVLTEKQKISKARLAVIDDILQFEEKELKKLQDRICYIESRVPQLRLKAANMKVDSQINSESSSLDIASGLTEDSPAKKRVDELMEAW